MFEEAMNASSQIESSEYMTKVIKLQAAIKYGEDDIQNAKVSTISKFFIHKFII